MQKQLNSVALAFLLISYKFIRQASTELCLSKVTDFMKSVNSLLRKLIDGEQFFYFLAESNFSLYIFGLHFCIYLHFEHVIYVSSWLIKMILIR